MHLNGHISPSGLGEMVGSELMLWLNCTAGEINGKSGDWDE